MQSRVPVSGSHRPRKDRGVERTLDVSLGQTMAERRPRELGGMNTKG